MEVEAGKLSYFFNFSPFKKFNNFQVNSIKGV